MMTDKDAGLELRSYRTPLNGVSKWVTHTIFSQDDDRVEVTDEDGNVLLTFDASCNVFLGTTRERIGTIRTVAFGNTWIFHGEGRCSGFTVTSPHRFVVDSEYDFVPLILDQLHKRGVATK